MIDDGEHEARLANAEFDIMMRKARARDAELERLEVKNIFSPPRRGDLRSHLRTVEQALECAVKIKDWQTVCEGIVLLQQAIKRVTN